MSRYRFVAAEKEAERTVTTACAALEVSPSAYYQWSRQAPSPRSQTDARLTERIAMIHQESRGLTAHRGCSVSYSAKARGAAANG